MATALAITVYRTHDDGDRADADLDAAFQDIVSVDRAMSLYRPDSELSLLNVRAGSGPIEVSESLFDVLSTAEEFARASNGAFDVTVQPLVELWGFYRFEHAAIPPVADIEQARGGVGHGRVVLDRAAKTVTLAPNTRVDLGGIAKGYAVDRAIATLAARGVPAALVDLGGNIGVLGVRPGGGPWSIGIQHPRERRLLGRVTFSAGATATSGDYDRFFEVDGRRFSHIIDPRTGWPVEGVAAATVVAPTAMAADALSTALFVLGPDVGTKLIASLPGTAGLIIDPDGHVVVQGNGDIQFELKSD